jgi:ornithine cyclodeaminase/alanine dehydrogenase-like protein (mu-crystallin family)
MMNVRYLTEGDVASLLDVPTAIDLLEAACRAQVAGDAQNAPRQRVRSGTTMMNVLPAALGGRVGHKTYPVVRPQGATFWVTLYGDDGTMIALIEADRLGQIRTGAASGLATRHLARADARVATVIGTGWQARTQLAAMCAARPIEQAYAWGRDAGRLHAFCAEMTAQLGLPVEPRPTITEAVREADVVAVMTTAAEPILSGGMLREGVHVNAAGSNRATSAEIDPEVVRRSALVAVEDTTQAQVEAGDLLLAERHGAWDWSRAVRLADIVAGTTPGRTSDGDITLFESLGIGLWDMAAANHVYDRAIAANIGTEIALPFVRST